MDIIKRVILMTASALVYQNDKLLVQAEQTFREVEQVTMEEEENWQFLDEIFSKKEHISIAHVEENLTAVRTILSKTLQFAI